MSQSLLIRAAGAVAALTIVNLAVTGTAFYNLRSHHIYNLEEHEARMDELEGTLRAHIGVIEEALDRIEGTQRDGDGTKGKKIEKLYGARGRDEKDKRKD